MSQDTTFVHGTIVQADFLNDTQEVDTGLAWGIRLAQAGSGSVETGVVGDPVDSQGPLIISGKRVWKNGASAPAVGSGTAGTREIFASTTDALAPNYNVEVLPTGNLPATAYYRRLGTADWDGVSILDNIKLTHGVQAEAEQFNQFTLRTISTGADDIPLTVEGYSTQSSVNSKLVSVGYDDGSTYRERVTVRGDGRIVMQAGTADYPVISAHVENDPVNRFLMTSDGVHQWGTGALAHDTYLERTAPGTLKLHDGAAGGDGVLDLVYLQNTDTGGGGAGVNGAGMVNVLDDLNLAAGKVFRINGVHFHSDLLADGTNVAHLSRTETFTGLKTFSSIATFTAGQAVTGTTGIGRVGNVANESILTSRLPADTNHRFRAYIDGTLLWGDGTNMDVVLSHSAPNILTLAAGDRFEQAYNAAVTEPTILVNRGTMDQTLNDETSSKAFALFIS